MPRKHIFSNMGCTSAYFIHTNENYPGNYSFFLRLGKIFHFDMNKHVFRLHILGLPAVLPGVNLQNYPSSDRRVAQTRGLQQW
jgi:hypothetical protein